MRRVIASTATAFLLALGLLGASAGTAQAAVHEDQCRDGGGYPGWVGGTYMCVGGTWNGHPIYV
ncbi:hypothetical protein [Streptomyces sp. RFCAC02]|uniref:hypothetical protein n=1 Tax=Streptomyces sp. RFCAC02 TaxID=2499143 RepID=UPI00101E9975|nr:hypothetical protein [Streptomyces sp. RFCAC02]